MFFHRAFGLTLASHEPVPGLPACPPTGEALRVRLREMPPWLTGDAVAGAESYPPGDPAEDPRPLRVLRIAERGAFLFLYPDGTRFVVERGGAGVWAGWPEAATLEDTATYLLGPVMGFVLRLRGVVSLHASAVDAGGRAIALAGPAGSGKSTTAAAFAGLGLPVLADDLLPLEPREGEVLAQPAYPRVRLWGDSAGMLFGDPGSLPLLTPNWDKRYLDLAEAGRFGEEPLPLAALYLLQPRVEDPGAPRVEEVSPREGLMALLANSYGNRLLDPSLRARDFEVLSRVARELPLRRVVPHRDPERLPALCRAVLDDFSALSLR